jgi:hypothetical protein
LRWKRRNKEEVWTVGHRYWGVLQCHEKGDPRGPLAIPLTLIQKHNGLVFERVLDRKPITVEYYYIKRIEQLFRRSKATKSLMESEAGLSRFKALVRNVPVALRAELAHRYHRNTNAHYETLSQTIFISKYPVTRTENSAYALIQLQSDDYQIIRGDPVDAWDSERAILEFKGNRNPAKPFLEGTVIVQDTKNNFSFKIWLLYEFTKSGAEEVSIRMQGVHVSDINLKNPPRWAQVVVKIGSISKARRAHLLSGAARPSASISKKILFMGNQKWEVKVYDRSQWKQSSDKVRYSEFGKWRWRRPTSQMLLDSDAQGGRELAISA